MVCESQVIAWEYERPLAVMVSVYGDESADETKQRVFAVAALIGTYSQWSWLRSRWSERTGGKEFHAAKCESEYANDPDPQKHKDISGSMPT
jgi:hypothetical protein